jgi:hypothetical protein
MLLVALRSPPFTPEVMEKVATALSLTLADVRTRTTGPGPWVLAIAAQSEALEEAGARLAQLGIHAVVCDPLLVPSDEDRLLARSLTLTNAHLLVTDAAGVVHECPWPSLVLLQRGTRASTTRQTTTTTKTKFSVGRALVTGGLSFTKKEVVAETKTQDSSERFVLLHRNDGENDVMLYERRLNYQFLGPIMQVSSYANLQSVIVAILARWPVREDSRVATPGFTGRLPKTRVDPLDLALYLAQLANAT